ncbi:MAG TPA: anti-sigma F factor antagonist [Thermoanaerobacterales bacterium]|jgi:stage II sporulation protein AA (anti-sigma F factor antagonist)|nr:anti-sigma F factor antagonist [Thermoanaerobacterales bacterium]
MDGVIKVKDEILKINLKGEVDHHLALQIKDEIDHYIEKHRIKRVLFNFKDVSFMDSSGVGMIIGRYKKLQKTGGKIGVVYLTPKIKRIFDISGLFNIINYFSNEKEALDKL